jgi:hypothetical protein
MDDRTVLFPPPCRTAACLLLALTLLPAAAGAALCLRVETETRNVATIAAAPGSTLRLSFRHSIYETIVQEFFDVGKNGFQISRLIYAEPRLAEFYGYEGGRDEDGSWVVVPEFRTYPSIQLRASPDSSMRLFLDSRPIPLGEAIEMGGAISVAPAICAGANDGR